MMMEQRVGLFSGWPVGGRKTETATLRHTPAIRSEKTRHFLAELQRRSLMTGVLGSRKWGPPEALCYDRIPNIFLLRRGWN